MDVPAPTRLLPALPSLSLQIDRLVELGVHDIAGLATSELRTAVEDWGPERTDALLAIDPQLAPASALTPLLRLQGGSKPGFVVSDMTDVDEFAPVIDGFAEGDGELAHDGGPAGEGGLPATRLYLVHDPLRGEELENWTPNEALPVIRSRSRSPLLLTEGIMWALQQPEVLERGHCFMTIGSRLKKANGQYDSRTPALWISNGTGRDGASNRDAPKVGWCWWGNRHTWLGIASAARRTAVSPAA